MDVFTNPAKLMSIASVVLLLLLTSNTALDFGINTGINNDAEDNRDGHLDNICNMDSAPVLDTDMVSQVTLYYFRLCIVFSLLDDEFTYWVKPRSMTWFSCFILEQSDEEQWLKIFV